MQYLYSKSLKICTGMSILLTCLGRVSREKVGEPQPRAKEQNEARILAGSGSPWDPAGSHLGCLFTAFSFARDTVPKQVSLLAGYGMSSQYDHMRDMIA